jgi:phosphatidylserine decarboxylase
MPRAVRRPVYATFARLAGVDLDEVELPRSEYPTFGSFFARRLRPGARPVAGERGAALAPCDGRVAATGASRAGRLIQAKGHDYALADLLADARIADALAGGEYITIYLSPRDYHRVHAPCDAELHGFDHVPGSLFPVSARWSARVPNLFARNERVVLHLRGEPGPFALVMIGAAGVGHIALTHAHAPPRRAVGDVQRVRFERPIRVARGDELGRFELGSTVVLAFAPGAVRLDVSAGDTVRCGAPLGRIDARAARGAA